MLAPPPLNPALAAEILCVTNRPQRVRLRLANATATAWPAGTIAALTWLLPKGRECPAAPAPLTLADPLGPGEACIILAELTPPEGHQGAARLRIAMAEAAGRPTLASWEEAATLLGAEAYAKGVLQLAVPAPKLPAGARVRLPLLLSNLSAVPWLARPPYRLNLWARIGGERVVMALAEDVGAGDELAFDMPVLLPAQPGRHKVRLSLVRPQLLTFNDHDGFSAVDFTLDLAPAGTLEVDPAFALEAPRLALAPIAAAAVGVAGQPLLLPLELTNQGRHPVDLVALTWAMESGPALVAAGRHPLPLRLAAEASRRLELPLGLAALAGKAALGFSAILRLGDTEQEPVPLGSLPLEVVAAEDLLQLQLAPQQPPARLLCEELQPVALRVGNRAAAPLLARGEDTLIVVQRWTRLDLRRPPLARGARRVVLDLPAEGTEVVVLPLLPPPEAGRYSLDLAARRLSRTAEDGRDVTCESFEVEVIAPRSFSFAEEKALRAELAAGATTAERLAYADWATTQDSFAGAALAELQAMPAAWPERPLVSLLLPVTAAALPGLAASLASIAGQLYPHWQLCLAPEAALDPAALAAALGPLANDPRLVLAAAATGAAALLRAALAEAHGPCCLMLVPGDALAPHALLFLVGETLRQPGLAVVYSDIDQLDAAGQRHSPCWLPGLDPDLAAAHHYLLRSALVRTAALRPALAATEAPAGVLAHDLALRLLEQLPPGAFGHVPHPLCHLAAPEAAADWAAGEAAVNAHLARRGSTARAQRLHDAPGYRIRPALPAPAPRCSILIPTRDGMDLLAPCIGSILDRTDYPDVEIIIIDNGSEQPATLAYLAQLQHAGLARVLRDDGNFNWSRLNNRAAAAATGQVLCLLNNDTEVLNDSWLHEMVAQAMRPEVGAVGAALWFPDFTLQHGGVMFNPRSALPMHLLRQASRGAVPDKMRLVRSVSAVTGACLVTRRDVYEALGRMDEVHLPIGYNDIDYCMKLVDRGLRCVWTPFAELLHKESASRGTPRTEEDRARHQRDLSIFAGRWRDLALSDPYQDPSLDPSPEVKTRYRLGAVARRHRYRLPRRRPLGIVHVPKTAGTALADLLRRQAAGLTVRDISAHTLLGCQEGNAAVIGKLRRWLPDVDVLISHVSHGFGAQVGWDCTYGTILRDPLERVVSQYRHLLREASSPFMATPLLEAPLGLLLRKGVLRGNLMLHKILGAPPERARWAEIDGIGAEFSGFDLPAEVWRRQGETLLEAPDLPPETDLALVDRAMATLMRDFAFVGRQEDLDAHLAALMAALGLPTDAKAAMLNVAPPSDLRLAPDDLAAAEAYHQLDRVLYDRIAALPGGLLLNPALLAPYPTGMKS